MATVSVLMFHYFQLIKNLAIRYFLQICSVVEVMAVC